MSSEDLILDVMHKAHALKIDKRVFAKVTELTSSIKIHDTYQRAQVFEQAYKLVIDEHTSNKNTI